MRPPMQKSALHQNEANRQQQQQQQQQQQHQQQQQKQQQKQQQQQQQQQHKYKQNQQQPNGGIVANVKELQAHQQPTRKSKLEQRELLVENHLNFACSALGTSQQPPARQRHQHQQNSLLTAQQLAPTAGNASSFQQPFYRYPVSHVISADAGADDSTLQLLDLSTSPPHEPVTYHTTPHSELIREPLSAQRSSLISQYSRSSSSEEGSVSLSAGYNSRANTFDDAAEHFVINFPADTSPIQHNPSDCIISLPLSETEPLLTDVEVGVVRDPERSICLSKNSASLIFTKKDPPSTANDFKTPLLHHNNHNNGNNNIRGPTNTTRRHHSSPRASSENDQKRKPSKHLPATFNHTQQQQRRSLQLNYNNNLVTTTTCSGANNNYCSSSSGLLSAVSDSPSGCGGKGVITKHHRHHSGAQSPTAATNTTTAAAARKQHAYSWYAPVYSALEEELEQDSRESSPIHNLANTKKQHINHYHHRSGHNSSSSTADNETVALLETRNQINIQAQLHAPTNREAATADGVRLGRKTPNLLPLQSSHNVLAATNNYTRRGTTLSSSGGSGGGGGGGAGDFSGVTGPNSYDAEGPHAASLGLAGGPQPRRIRFGNFLKSLVGLRPSATAARKDGMETHGPPTGGEGVVSITPPTPLPASPEITITRTPSEQNMVVLRDPAGRRPELFSDGGKKLANGGSTSSLNVMQQKLWNIMRREGSATSLHQEKSQSIVQYTGLRKCETVLALTRQTNSLCSPTFVGSPGGLLSSASAFLPHSGSGVYSANGVEQIRPLNRLRNSVSSMNATCSRCSSLLSLAASGSHYSLGTSGVAASVVRHQRNPSNVSNNNTYSSFSRNAGEDVLLSGAAPSAAAAAASVQGTRKCFAANSSTLHSPSNLTPTNSTSSTTPTSSPTATATATATTPVPLASLKGLSPATCPTTHSHPLTVSSLLNMSSDHHRITNTGSINVISYSADAAPALALTSTTSVSVPSSSTKTASNQTSSPFLENFGAAVTASNIAVVRPFETFTCKLCLVDVESANEATTLYQCGCHFCTECMRAYVEFEISEGAYEISCPDAQCPAQGIMTLPEIAKLTTNNLMKKHHRYRLNREIELDKTRTWCPRAGCETVCRVGPSATTHFDSTAPSTSTATIPTTTTLNGTTPGSGSGSGSGTTTTAATTPQLCAVQCPSCKDEFCSACKKTWHPNITCEEHSRRLVADGQDDIGIPFDNDLIKCCPMCAVPIEKDEGCAQMMCKRCKHVFCWYCLASLDDDFLLRHYDKGPCKNKLGHSRASVVWHRAQVIGIFAGFGILLLVASPLLLLAAPCIICCKCRSCSGSKVDEGDGDTDEATALQR